MVILGGRAFLMSEVPLYTAAVTVLSECWVLRLQEYLAYLFRGYGVKIDPTQVLGPSWVLESYCRAYEPTRHLKDKTTLARRSVSRRAIRCVPES